MNSELKRIIIAGALAAAAFNATAPSHRVTGAGLPAFPFVTGESSNGTTPIDGISARPSRIRIERCGARRENDAAVLGVLTTI